MTDAIAYRGPDGSGVWSDAEAGVVLAHRRLAIIDLTPTGAQPMVSSDGRWVISYNGEVYNAAAIARAPELRGFAFRGTSDTEIILESVARRGLDGTLADLNGMFAIALWDRATRTLHLIRDRLGIKPLFLAATQRGVWFASELKALAAAGLDMEIDPASVTSFLRFGYVPTPFSIFRNVTKLRPGEIVSIDADRNVTHRQYWSIAEVAAAGLANPFTQSETQAEAELHDLLADAVAGQMISDVPLGAFLSGGINSSTVVALMVAARRGPVRTFSIGFPDFGYDESKHAKAVAQYLGTEHHELTVTAADALAVVPLLADMYDEPFANSSQIPTHLISKLTRAHVTVALSGDGGDELFGGYNRYALGYGFGGLMARSPAGLRRGIASIMRATPVGLVDALARIAPAGWLPAQPADKLRKLAAVLPLDREAIYLRLVSQCPDPAALTCGVAEHPIDLKWRGQGDARPVRRTDATVRYRDLSAGRYPAKGRSRLDGGFAGGAAAAARSSGGRVRLASAAPFANSWRRNEMAAAPGAQPLCAARTGRTAENGLRHSAGELVAWAAADWAEDLLDPARLGGGLLDVTAVRNLWAEHISGHSNWAYALWTVLMYEGWRRRWAAF